MDKFFADTYENFLAMARGHIRDEGRCRDLIGDFVATIMTKSKRLGTNTIERYDPKLSDYKVTFIHYIFKQFRYALMNPDQFSLKAISLDTCSDPEQRPSGSMNEDYLSFIIQEEEQNPESAINYKMIIEKIFDFTEKLSKENNNRFCMEKYAKYLIESRVNGLSNRDMAEELKISSSAISQWIIKLEAQIFKHLGMDRDEVLA